MIVLDTSVLIDGLTGLKRSESAVRGALADGERILLPALVLYEWLRGPRLAQELAAQEALCPAKSAIPFGTEEAIVSADLYRAVRRARNREIDLAIAACALVREARLWTLNHADFQDVPGIRFYGHRSA
ncbi:MAG: PIN domain-containing protein [Candidatus Solibacter sp.]|nr:PIN domain-containing protein [Candidatus Solibacter sp.]